MFGVLKGRLSVFRRAYSSSKHSHVDFGEEIEHAVRNKLAVVALESTIITHGMPYPKNVECAHGVQDQVRRVGAIPATIGILNGRIKIGLTDEEINMLGDVAKVASIKTSRRDLAYVISGKLHGGTTVSATLIAANLAGIPIFATGGIGGVHRMGQNTFDISADLTELGRTAVAVVSSGVKSILDIPKTLEYLETQGVFVCSYGAERFPAFYTRDSGCESPYRVSSAVEAAGIIKTARELNMNSGMLFGVPVPEEFALDGREIDEAIKKALEEAENTKISGKEITPFLLAHLSTVTQGKSLTTNIALVQNNAKVAAEIALALSKLQGGDGSKCSPIRRNRKEDVVVFGGSILDTVVTVHESNIKFDGRIHAGRISECAGGVARNMCEALGKLSHPAAFVSAIGDDVAGNVIADSLFPHVEHIARVRDGRTAQCMVILDGAGDCKFLVGDMDIHSRITPEIVRGKEELIRNAKMVVLDGNPTLDTMEIVLRLAGEFNVPVLFEPTDVPICQKPFKTKFWQSIKYITPNFNELKYIAKSLNLNIPNTKNNINNACELAKEVAKYIENVVVTLGADGVVIARRNSAKTKLLQPPGDKEIEARHYPGLVVDGLVNVSGAGDCFAAGLIIGMLEGLVEEECVAVGLASAVCALKSASTVPETLKRESVVNEDLDVAKYVSY